MATDAQDARDFLHKHVKPSPAALVQAVLNVQKDGFTTAVAAITQTDAEFWDTWVPGDEAASDLLDNGGLRTLLDAVELTIKGMTDTTLDRMGTLLAEGAARGDSVDTIARALGDIVDDPKRAYQIADTELARAMSAATTDVMRGNGTETMDWLVSDGCCDECREGEADSPHPLSDADLIPAHPGCRCAWAPNSSLPLDSALVE